MTARRTIRIALFASLTAALVVVPFALAGKGGGSGTGGSGGGGKPSHGGTGGTSYTGTINNLVLVDPTADGLPHWNHTITFNVTSTAQYYFVRVDCSQNGVLVYDKSNGFYPGWLWGTTYGLSGPSWTGGPANCVATLYSQNLDGSNQQTEATMSFAVYA